MTDIWDEKPEPVGETSVAIFHWKEEMAEWLEKVEAEYNEFYGDNFIYFSILNEITKHMKAYPDEKDSKYIIGKMAPDTAGRSRFNSVYFLTHLETWITELKETLIPFQSSEVNPA